MPESCQEAGVWPHEVQSVDQVSFGLLETGPGEPPRLIPGTEVGLDGPLILEFLIVFTFGCRDVVSKFICDRPRNLVVHAEEVNQVAIVSFAPLSSVRAYVSQLKGGTKLVTLFANRAINDEVDAELTSGFPQCFACAF